MLRLRNYIKLIRVKSYVKNTLIFAPAFFADSISFDNVVYLFWGFLSFSLTASLIYVINDIVDIDYDKNHPIKKHRPLASGEISLSSAKILIVFLILSTLIFNFFLKNIPFMLILIVYFVVNLLYSFYLKNIAVLDLLTLSFSYILRLVAGSVLLGIYLSPWIILVTFGLSLLLGAGKRMEDLLLSENGYPNTRKVSKEYSLEFLKVIILFSSFYVIFVYTTYSVISYPGTLMYLTNIPVFLGFLRYFQIIFQKRNYYDPTTIILKDNILKLIILLWIFMFVAIKELRI